MTLRKITPFILIVVSFQLTGCLTLLSLVVGNKQQYQWNKGSSEISVSYGRLSGTELLNGLGDGDNLSAYERANTGNIFATGRYYVNNRFALGMAIGTQSIIYDWRNDNNGTSYTQKVDLTTAGAEVKCLFANTRYFQYYELLAIATTYRNETYSNLSASAVVTPQTGFKWNMQWSPVGLRFGNAVGGFLELGVGYKGLINGGIYYQVLHRKKQSTKTAERNSN